MMVLMVLMVVVMMDVTMMVVMVAVMKMDDSGNNCSCEKITLVIRLVSSNPSSDQFQFKSQVALNDYLFFYS